MFNISSFLNKFSNDINNSEIQRLEIIRVIKEVSNIVPDVSEKTIQRELLNLVSEGVLKKTGEKRWSKYSLKV